jgi:hypothetical protein
VTVTSRNRSVSSDISSEKSSRALLEEARVARKAFDLPEIVRRDKDGRLRRTLQQDLDEFIAHQRMLSGQPLTAANASR